MLGGWKFAWRLDVDGWSLEFGGWRLEVGGRRLEVGLPSTLGRGAGGMFAVLPRLCLDNVSRCCMSAWFFAHVLKALEFSDRLWASRTRSCYSCRSIGNLAGSPSTAGFFSRTSAAASIPKILSLLFLLVLARGEHIQPFLSHFAVLHEA